MTSELFLCFATIMFSYLEEGREQAKAGFNQKWRLCQVGVVKGRKKFFMCDFNVVMMGSGRYGIAWS